MNGHGSRVIALAALVSAALVIGCHPALARAQAPETPVGLPRLRDYERIPQLRDIHFDLGQAAVRPGDAKILDASAAWLRANPGQLLLIEGHCDNRGPGDRKNEFNMALGERRAAAAMNYLVARGVQADRITILSYGEERPLCAEENERCWSQNRRARFLVKPREEAAGGAGRASGR